MSVLSRALAIARRLGRALAWPFTGEVEHPRPSEEELEERVREMTLGNRDQSRSA
jgi:hypothetical protein